MDNLVHLARRVAAWGIPIEIRELLVVPVSPVTVCRTAIDTLCGTRVDLTEHARSALWGADQHGVRAVPSPAKRSIADAFPACVLSSKWCVREAKCTI